MTTSYMPQGYSMAPIKPLAPYEDRPGDNSRDFAAAGSYSLYALERMLRDCTEQPDWRLRAKLCAAYYDGKQLDELRRWKLLEEAIDERPVNLIRPIINSVLGQEARSRTDVRIEADDDEFADVAEVISGKLKEAERETYAHAAVSDAYASMVKKGLGWVHVCRNADPLAYPYRFESVDVDEIWWDWRGMGGRTRMDDRCRWLARMRMVDLDEAIAAFPKQQTILERTVAGWDDPRIDTAHLLGEPMEFELVSAYENVTRFNTNWRKWDWVDAARKMVKMIEVWYRVPAMAVVLVISPTRRIPYNAKDPRHVEMVSRGLVPIVKGPTSQVRRALYAGPHRLLDEATDRKSFPYIPFFAYRDDGDKSPYGLVDGMLAPQDDYNDRRHRIQWMLKARQLFIDNDALDTKFNTISEVADAINRPDLVAILNANRRNKDKGIRVDSLLSMQKEQFTLLDHDELMIQKSVGRYGSQLGDAQVQSGIANQLLVEQGEQAMGEMNDNYIYARRSSFEALVGLIVEDHKRPNMPAALGTGKSRRTIILNTYKAEPLTDETGAPITQPQVDPQTGQPVTDQTGQPVMQPVMGPPMPTNMVCDAEIRTGLAEVPNTPAYRAQLQGQLKEVIQALAGNAPALNVVTPAYIESTNLANRSELADDFRRATGQPPAGDKNARQQWEGEQQASAAQAQQLEKEKGLAEVEEREANKKLRDAQTRKTNAEATALERRNHMGAPEAEAMGAHLKNATDAMGAESAANDEDAALNAAVQDGMKATA
jgi:hypothetical protein